MTVGMEQHCVRRFAVAPVASPAKVMDMPAFFQRQHLPAHRATAVLLTPKVSRPSLSRQGVGHATRQALLKVQFPFRVVRVRFTLNLYVTANVNVTGLHQLHRISAARPARNRTVETPARDDEVLLRHPMSRLAAVSPSRPTPQPSEDHTVDVRKRSTARSMPVIQRPAANLRVQTLDQLSICVMLVFSWESSRPRSFRKCATRGCTSSRSSAWDMPVIMKSSA